MPRFIYRDKGGQKNRVTRFLNRGGGKSCHTIFYQNIETDIKIVVSKNRVTRF